MKNSKRKEVGKNIISLSTYHKNLEHIKLAISDRTFKKDVEEIRNRLKIPPEGLAETSDLQAWEAETYKQENELLASEPLRDQRKHIKEKSDKDEISKEQAGKQLKLLYQKFPLNYLKLQVEFLVDSYRLPRNFEDYIRLYILTGKISAPAHNFSITEHLSDDFFKAREPRYIDVRIYTHLTNDDLGQIQTMVNNIFPRKLPRYKKLKTDIELQIKIEETLQNKTQTHMDDGKEKTYKVTAKEIAEEHFGSAKERAKVYEVMRSLENIRRKRFGNK